MTGNQSLKISSEKVELEVVGKTEMCDMELITEAAIALINGIDVKDAESNHHYELFDVCMERILSAVHAQCEWAGWE